MSRKYYMVRAMGSSEKSFQVFEQESVVAIGWSKVDFTQHNSSDERRQAIDGAYYFNEQTRPAPTSLGRKHAQISRFCEIKQGDYILVPYHNQVLLAEATGEQLFSPAHVEADLANQQRVRYLKAEDGKLRKILRTELLEGLQRRLRMLGSIVLDLSEFADEIERVFNNPEKSVDASFREKTNKRIDDFVMRLLQRIADGDTHLPGGGRGLECLVVELLRCDGYESVEMLDKRYFPEGADADIKAMRSDVILGSQTYLFQVKHHRDESGTWGIEQLIKAARSCEETPHRLVFITSASINEEARKLADINDIICMDGKQLGAWIYENCRKLSFETTARLGISLVPELI